MTSITTQLLAVLSGGAIAGIAVAALALGLAAGVAGYMYYYKHKVGTAKSEADKVKAEAAKIIEDAKVEAKTARKEALLEAKEEEHRLRAEIDKEAKERKAEYQKTEQRLQSKESYLDKKDDALDKKQEQLEVQKKQLQSKEEELQNIEDKLKNSQFLLEKELERISGMTRDEAKQQLMDALIDSAKKDAVQTAKQIEAEAKENAEKKAQNIISLAIQRCAADHTTDTTVSVVALPNDEMKGRIIGRVGRNIRALESATGVDLIIDDTPDVVTLSGFDPVRREIARITLEKLIQDGRIHPARIEEMVDKVKKEVDGLIKEAGENAVFECGIYGIHPELIKILGKLKYRTSYGQNVLQHSLEVAFLAGVMASELGADVKIAKRAGLLHDIGKAVDHEIEGTHVQIGVDLLKNIRKARLSSTRLRLTTATSRQQASKQSLFRQPTLFRAHVPAHVANRLKITSNALKSWKQSQIPSTASNSLTQFRQGAKSALWSNPRSSTTPPRFSLQKKSPTSWKRNSNTPDKSKLRLSGKSEASTTQNNQNKIKTKTVRKGGFFVRICVKFFLYIVFVFHYILVR